MGFPAFTVYPAIDLRGGRVVRLRQGDPNRQTVFDDDPGAAARRWLSAGAGWLHVVNLDGAFGEEEEANHSALEAILRAAAEHDARVQFGGGLRSAQHIADALSAGVDRVVIGTAAVENPALLQEAIETYGPDRIAAGVDARDGLVRIRGWAESTPVRAVDLALRLQNFGLRRLIFTDVARDGTGGGLNLLATLAIAATTGLQVIASGGVNALADLEHALEAGLAGVIVGRALYEGRIRLDDLRAFLKKAAEEAE